MKATAQELEHRFDVKVELTQDEQTGRQIVRIFSEDGERLIRQLPPQAALELAYRARRNSIMGLLTSVA